MGILNVTPDSFSDGGRFDDVTAALRHAHGMVEAGAEIIDVGGESTRPGSDGVSVDEELDRVLPVVEALAQGSDGFLPLDVPVSIDTSKPAVASAALAAGATIINDVTAASDPEMAGVMANAGDDVPVVIMHMRGAPRSMQLHPVYHDVVGEVRRFLDKRARVLIDTGVNRNRIVVDPGIGFGKRLVDNLDLLKNIDVLRSLGYPVLVGASRKSFIGTLLDAGTDDRLNGSLAVAARCYQRGVEIVRVHDVKETVELMRVLDAMERPDSHRTNE